MLLFGEGHGCRLRLLARLPPSDRCCMHVFELPVQRGDGIERRVGRQKLERRYAWDVVLPLRFCFFLLLLPSFASIFLFPFPSITSSTFGSTFTPTSSSSARPPRMASSWHVTRL